jgi:hypothetical protein
MATTPEAAKRRWKKLPKAERRRLMQPAIDASKAQRLNRLLSEAIERVKAAGYQVEKAS